VRRPRERRRPRVVVAGGQAGDGCGGGADFECGGDAHSLSSSPLSGAVLFPTGEVATVPVGILTVVTGDRKIALPLLLLLTK
jgi:hypothetical protein